jgi:two-component system, NtrC family, sensor histidine kinase GlrK
VRVRTKLRGAFAVYIALLAGLSWYQVLTTRRAVSSARELTDIATRFRDISTIQLGRLTEAWADAQRFKITHGDTAFIGRMEQTLHEYDAELHRLDSASLSKRERALLPPLIADWNHTLELGMGLREHARDTATFSQLKESLDRVSGATESLASASQDAMSAELAAVEVAEQDAEQVTLGAAAAAVLLSVILTALIARSILEPLARLTEGTREVSAGRFSHRLTPSGNDELARVAREFNAMTERLDELDRMKREFVSKVSHDLKTPLSSMQETTAVMLDEVPGPLSPKQRQLLLINQESGQRLYAMITKLLDLSRIEAGLDAERQVINVESLIRRSVDHLVEGSSATRVTVEAETGPSLRVLGELDSLTQVFDNLLDNALKFSPFDGNVVIRVASIASRGTIPPERWAAVRRSGIRAPASVMVTVSDEGPGITDEEKERVFDRFYQTAAGRSVRSRGVGLGLAICREIIAVHGGAIWVSDNEPRGSVFNVLLPGVGDAGEAAPSPPVAATAVRRRA